MIFGFSLVIFLVVLFGIYNYSVIVKSNEEANNIVEKELPVLIANEQMARTLANRISTARGYVLYGGDFKDRFNEYTEEGKRNEAIVREIGASEEFDKLIERTVEWRKFVATEVFEEYDKGNVELARKNLAEKNPEVRELMAGYEEQAQKSQVAINEAEKAIVKNGEKSLKVTIVVTILVILVSIATALITSNIIAKPIIKVMERMKLIASGDLSNEPLETTSQDEVGHLVVATNEMSNNVRKLLGEINVVSDLIKSQSEELTQSANEVSAGSQQVASTMQELASGTESQATNAGELASIMVEFTTTVQEADANGERIQKASNEVFEMTSKGSHLMELSNKQMEKIDQIVQEAVQKVQGLDASHKKYRNWFWLFRRLLIRQISSFKRSN